MSNAKQTVKKSETRESTAPTLIAWHVVERGENKPFWHRIGAAWNHEDGEGMTLQLDLLPAQGGRIILRQPKADDSKE